MSTSTEKLQQDWLSQLSGLIEDVRQWAQDLGWATREIEKSLDDSELGRHKVPALLMQKNTVQILLEPITRQAPGANGVVDMYLLPRYDDIASLYYLPEGWQLHYIFPGHELVAAIRDAKSKPLSQENFTEVIEQMVKNAD